MKKLFYVEEPGRLKFYTDKKSKAKEVRDEINKRIKKGNVTVKLGPDHWRYNDKSKTS